MQNLCVTATLEVMFDSVLGCCVEDVGTPSFFAKLPVTVVTLRELRGTFFFCCVEDTGKTSSMFNWLTVVLLKDSEDTVVGGVVDARTSSFLQNLPVDVVTLKDMNCSGFK